jgi:Na+-translocating ferredoxin:NAD+ oxidoreductase RnfD subunit
MKGITDMDTDNLIITGDSSEKRHKITMPEYLTVSSSPHVRASSTTQSVMLTVLIALLPALVWGIYIYGLRPLAVTLLSVLTCVVSEFLYEKLMKKRITVGDLSAAVTGVIFAFNLPPAVPYYLVVVGGVFAIVVVKQLFGGIGKNIVNPALAARVFLFSWAGDMTKFASPGNRISSLAVTLGDADVVAGASADGFKIYIYYFDHNCGVIGGYVADCIDI